jgi:anti-anti-sigma factor
MRSNLTTSVTTERSLGQGQASAPAAGRTRIIPRQRKLAETTAPGPRLAVDNTRVWSHTLILTGELDHRAAPELEEEIECLCEEGVTQLTLDLRQLDAIDSTGVTVIGFRSAICKRRGHEFAVIPGSRVIHRALAEAGVGELLDADGARRPSAHAGAHADGSAYDRSTTMVKVL